MQFHIRHVWRKGKQFDIVKCVLNGLFNFRNEINLENEEHVISGHKMVQFRALFRKSFSQVSSLDYNTLKRFSRHR